MLLPGTFTELPGNGRKVPKLTGAGSFGVGDGGFELTGHRNRPVLGFFAGSAGFVLGLALVIAATLALDSLADIDMMAYRKGPMLVGMSALALGVTLGGFFIKVMGWLFGRLPVSMSIPRSAVEGIALHNNSVAILWTDKGKSWAVAFAPAEVSASSLHATLTGKAR